MAKKNKLPKWLLDSADQALDRRVCDLAAVEMDRKCPKDPDYEAKNAAWMAKQDAWLINNPRPERVYDPERQERIFLDAAKVIRRRAKPLLKRIKAGEFTAAQLLKAVENFS